MAAVTGRWTFMDPWREILRTHGAHFKLRGAVGDDGIRGLSVSLQPQFASSSENIGDRCRALRDALELVFLLLAVDQEAFLQELAKLSSHDSAKYLRQRLLCEGDDFPYYVMIEKTSILANDRTWVHTAISTIFKPVMLHDRDQAFQDARLELLRATESAVVYDKVKIVVGFYGFDWTWAAHDLANLTRTEPPPAADYPFRLIELHACIGKATDSDQLLADVNTCRGDPHNRVRFGSVRVVYERKADEATRGDLLCAVLSKPYSGIEERSEKVPGVVLELTTPSNHRLTTQLCSSVMYAPGVERLTLDWGTVYMHVSHRTRLMRWIMLSLFSSRARHGVQELTLTDFFVNEGLMDDLEAFLLSKNPLQILQGGQEARLNDVDNTSRSYKQVFLTKGTCLWLNPITTREVATSKWKTARLEQGSWADVVADVADTAADREHNDLLVPCYGLCRVRRVDIQRHRVIGQSQDTHSRHGIKSLTLNWHGGRSRRIGNYYSGLCRFLDLVGAPLEALVLQNTGMRDVTSVLETLWTACPLLVRLELHHVDSECLSQISNAYESTKCRVTHLVVRGLQRQRGSQDVIEFCEALSDPQRPIARTLTELSLDIERIPTGDMTDEEIATMVSMLECNTKLVSVSIRGWGFREELRSRFTAQNNQPLPSQKIPLVAKLAFLSVVYSRGRLGEVDDGTEAPRVIMERLGSDVLARIFDLAAKPVRRKVWLGYSY